MARLPTAFDLSGPESLRSGRQISSADTSAIGRGIASLGASIQQAGRVAASMAEEEKRKATALGVARANAYQDQESIALANRFDQDPDYATFGDRAGVESGKIASTAAEFIDDPEARELWKVQADSTAARVTDSITDRGVQLKRQDDLVKFDEALEVQRRIYTDPNTSADQKAAARAKLEGSLEVAKATGLILPDEYDARKKAYLEGADFDRAKLDTTLLNPREAYFASIRSAESGGNDAAKNPNSSATGRYQFTEPTWNRLVAAYPDAGLTKDGRLDPVQQERAIRLFTAENERTLAGAGLPGTNGNLYAAHFLGAGGAVDVLSAPDGSALEGLLPSEVIKANPFLKGMTVADFKAWTNEKSGGAGTVLPSYVERLSPEQRQIVFDMRASEAAQAATAQLAQAKIEYANLDGSIGLGIVTGDVVSEQQILDSALDDADKAKHIKAFRSEADATTEARGYLAGLANGTAPTLNPYNSDDRSLVDKAYGELLKVVPEDQRAAAGEQFVTETGMVPDALVADVRRNINSTDVATVVTGLEQSSRLYDAAPQALEGVSNGDDLRTAALTYDDLVNNRGMTPQQAAEELIRQRDPATKQRAEVLKTAWNTAIKDGAFSVDDVRKAFDTSFWVGEPMAGLTPDQVLGLEADYLDAAERAFRGDANGDVGLAKTLALDTMKRTYGVSSVSGSEVIMKYPPEKFYPAVDGEFGYIRDAALADAKTVDPEAQNVMLVPDRVTGQDIRGGAAPRYNLMFQRPDGVWDMVPGYFAITDEDFAAVQAKASEERKTQFEVKRAEEDATKKAVDEEARWLELQAETFGSMGGAPK